jgi:predicted RNase H-like HicB family nuclease
LWFGQFGPHGHAAPDNSTRQNPKERSWCRLLHFFRAQGASVCFSCRVVAVALCAMPFKQLSPLRDISKKARNSYGAYVADLPGCIAVAGTKAEVEKLIADAISFHIEGLQRHDNPIPEPASEVEYIKTP